MHFVGVRVHHRTMADTVLDVKQHRKAREPQCIPHQRFQSCTCNVQCNHSTQHHHTGIQLFPVQASKDHQKIRLGIERPIHDVFEQPTRIKRVRHLQVHEHVQKEIESEERDDTGGRDGKGKGEARKKRWEKSSQLPQTKPHDSIDCVMQKGLRSVGAKT